MIVPMSDQLFNIAARDSDGTESGRANRRQLVSANQLPHGTLGDRKHRRGVTDSKEDRFDVGVRRVRAHHITRSD